MISAHQGGVYMGNTHEGMESADSKNDQSQQPHKVVKEAPKGIVSTKSKHFKDCDVSLEPSTTPQYFDSKENNTDLKKRQELKHHIEKAAELVADVVNITEMDGKLANCGPTLDTKEKLNSKNYLGNLLCPLLLL